MTKEDLEQLAINHEQATLTNNDWDEGGGYIHEAVHATFEEGFQQCLTRVVQYLKFLKSQGIKLSFDERDLFQLLKA